MKKTMVLLSLVLVSHNVLAASEMKLELNKDVKIADRSEKYLEGNSILGLYKSSCYIMLRNMQLNGEELTLNKGTTFTVENVKKEVIETEWFYYPKLSMDLKIENSNLKVDAEINCRTDKQFILSSSAENHYVSVTQALRSLNKFLSKID